MQTNPYKAPESLNIGVESGTIASDRTAGQRSVTVRILAVLGIALVATFELDHALTYSIRWQDYIHLIAATGAMCYLFSACKDGKWSVGRVEKSTPEIVKR
jgi:uncharacterized membrane protein